MLILASLCSLDFFLCLFLTTGKALAFCPLVSIPCSLSILPIVLLCFVYRKVMETGLWRQRERESRAGGKKTGSTLFLLLNGAFTEECVY